MISFQWNMVKPKQVISLTNYNTRIQQNEPIKTRSRIETGAKRGKMLAIKSLGFGFTSDWLRKWREPFQPIIELSNGKLKQMKISFDSWLKPLYGISLISVHFPPPRIKT